MCVCKSVVSFRIKYGVIMSKYIGTILDEKSNYNLL
jgi:hypothetical protein